MLRPSLIAILQARNAPFTPDQLQNMSEGQAWDWVRHNCPVKVRSRVGGYEVTIPGVCFSGMDTDSRPMLREYAALVGFRIASAMSSVVDYLVVGDHPGPSKLEYARECALPVIPVADFVQRAEELYQQALDRSPYSPPKPGPSQPRSPRPMPPTPITIAAKLNPAAPSEPEDPLAHFEPVRAKYGNMQIEWPDREADDPPVTDEQKSTIPALQPRFPPDAIATLGTRQAAALMSTLGEVRAALRADLNEALSRVSTSLRRRITLSGRPV